MTENSMAHLAWFQERKRLFLLSYNELLYLLKKYPKRNPYPSETTKDQCTQTSPHRFNRYYANRTYKNITFINDTDTTAVMTPSPSSKLHKSKANAVSPASSITTTVVMTPSPDSKRIKKCSPTVITCSPNINSSMNVHEAAKKASHSLLNSLIDPNDSENDTQHCSQSMHKTKRRRKRKRSHISNKTLHTLTKTLSQCSIDSIEDHRPLKKRKMNTISPSNMDTQHRQQRKNMLLQYYNMNKGNGNGNGNISPIKARNGTKSKPKLMRSSNKSGINTYQIKDVYNDKTNKKLVFTHVRDTVSFEVTNSYESIESLSPHHPDPVHIQYPSKKCIKKDTKNTKKRKKKHKHTISSIPRRLEHKDTEETDRSDKKQNKKTKRRSIRSSLQLHAHVKENLGDGDGDDATFFGLLPELDEQDINGCDKLVSERNEVNVEHEEKQMSHDEIIRFENAVTPRYGRIEAEWKAHNESIPDSNGTEQVVITKQHRYTPLWRATTKLPSDEMQFDIKKLKACNDPHPLYTYSDEYLNDTGISPTTKLAQNSMKSDVMDYTHSQIVAKYQGNVVCLGNDNSLEEYSASKESLFANTNFSAERGKVNSLLGESNTEHNEKYLEDLQMRLRDKVQNNKNKYSIFEYPQD